MGRYGTEGGLPAVILILCAHANCRAWTRCAAYVGWEPRLPPSSALADDVPRHKAELTGRPYLGA